MALSANALVMKEININLVRKTLKGKGEATKHQIAEATGLSTVTIGTILQKLVDDNIAIEVGFAASTGGRPAQSFRFNENHSHALVLFTHEQDGQDRLHVRVANLNGVCIDEVNTSLDEIKLDSFEPYVEVALQKCDTIRVISFGLPGIEMDGRIVGGDYPALTGTAFAAHYQARYQLPVIVENDVNAASIGYCKRHRLEAEAAAIYLYFPQKYPPGGGIYMAGGLYKGWSNYAGEIAGMPLGINWHDQKLYRSRRRVCDALATLITAISMLLNPHKVILYGSFLTDRHLSDIRQQCDARLPAHAVPRLCLATDFTLDYQYGTIAQALALLEPDTPISL
jgi:predicted NBD/HSP70 family sugar kinase